MATPLASEKIVRAILKTLVHCGTLASAADIALLEAIPVNATDAQIDGVVALLTHAVTPITGVSTADLISDTDVTCWVNSDALPAFLSYNHYFRVATWGTTIADVSKSTEWATITRKMPSATNTVEMVLGPLAARLSNAAPDNTTGYPASINIGSYYDVSSAPNAARYRGVISGGATALTGNGFSADGLNIWTKNSMELAAKNYLGVVDSASNAVRGGFYGLGNDGAAFFVGAYPFAAADALLISKMPGVAVHDFQLRMNRFGQYETIYVNSAENTLYSACLAVNSNDTVGALPTSRKPTLYPGAGTVPAFSAFGTTSGKDTVGLFSSPDTDYTGGSVLRILSGDDTNPNLYSLILAERWNGAAYVPMFRVHGDGTVHATSHETPAIDLAEWMPADRQYDPGTVLVLRGGVATASDRYRAAGVVGVVTTKPGLVLGAQDDHTGQVCVARTGMVPVKFSTEFGGVDGNGEMLCSGPDGHCVRAPQFPEPGTIVGKAMGTLHRADDGSITTGVIMAVVG